MNGRRAHQRDPRLDLALERSACGLWPPCTARPRGGTAFRVRPTYGRCRRPVPRGWLTVTN
jgi:hypothetical protein